MSITESIILGVFTGVVTSAALVIIGQIFYKIFIPWYQSIIYKGINISGEWTYEMNFDSGNKSHFFAKIYQKAGYIECTITEAKTVANSNKTEARVFKYKGKLVDRLLTLTGRDTSERNFGVYTFLLEIKGGGKTMEGFTSRYCLTDHIIKGTEIVWVRKEIG